MVSYDDSVRLVLCCQKGDRQSLGKLAQLVQQRFWGYLCKKTSNDDTAADILQEILLTVVLKIKQLRNPERFWSWVTAVARSKVQENFRRSDSRSRGEDEFGRNSSVNRRRDFRIQIEHREALRKIYLACKDLRGSYATVFELRCFKNMSYSEIVDVTGYDLKNVYIRFHRARKFLCKRFRIGVNEFF